MSRGVSAILLVAATAMIAVMTMGDPLRVNTAVKRFFGWQPDLPARTRLVPQMVARQLRFVASATTVDVVREQIERFAGFEAKLELVEPWQGRKRFHGILGGISTGQDIRLRFAIKPTSSILSSRQTVNLAGENTEISTKGRHDPCVGIRAVPVGEAMMACVLADHVLLHRAQCGA